MAAKLKGKWGVMFVRDCSISQQTWVQWREDDSWHIIRKAQLLCADGKLRTAECHLDRSGYTIAKVKIAGKTVTGALTVRWLFDRGISGDEYCFVARGRNAGLVPSVLW
jgi:hypothetical protein